MDITIYPGKLSGQIAAIPSKSFAHRALICAAFSQGNTTLLLDQINADIEATADCLCALGAKIQRTGSGYHITPVEKLPGSAVLYCRESGSTLRFLLPVVGALGVDATFVMEGRLPERPLSPLWEEMERMGCNLSRTQNGEISCTGKLKSGVYRIAGNVSSQFISGLLFAGCLMDAGIDIILESNLESAPYVDMTRAVLSQFGVFVNEFSIMSGSKLISPGKITVEGDWSNAAFYLTAKFLGSTLDITGLNHDSIQGDRRILQCFVMLKEKQSISAADIPDLIPILSIAATVFGGVFTNIQRLRLKESDRIDAILKMIESLGGSAQLAENTLTVFPVPLIGGTVNSCGDHRIAMSAAIAATICNKPVTILGAESVNKSYPRFWADYHELGGRYEQYLR